MTHLRPLGVVTEARLLVIGAGRYSLATAAPAQAVGIEPLVVGRPMGFWRRKMPAGMLQRSSLGWHLDPHGGWPEAPHRTLRNSTVRAWERAGSPTAPDRPGERTVVAHAPDGSRLYRYGADPAVAGATGNVEALALYAGQSAGIVRDVLPAVTIVDELIGAPPRRSPASPPARNHERRSHDRPSYGRRDDNAGGTLTEESWFRAARLK